MKKAIVTIGSVLTFISESVSDLYPHHEARALAKRVVSYVTGLSHAAILASPDVYVSTSDWHKINKICTELKKAKPIQYIIPETMFYDLRFKVNEDVLIPRPETEEMVDLIIKENQRENARVLDIGTGSGCIAVALARNLKSPDIYGIDISADALKNADENAKLNRCNINLTEADILSPDFKQDNLYDIIVSNPPYVRNSERAGMHKNVYMHEPSEALFVSDDDPLVFYRHIINFSRNHLASGGRIYLEINEAFGDQVKILLEETGLYDSRIITDMNNKERIVTGTRNEK